MAGSAGRPEPTGGSSDLAALVAVKAHSWLNMAAVIGGSAVTLLDDLDRLERDDLRWLLRAIGRQAERLEASLVEVLDVVATHVPGEAPPTAVAAPAEPRAVVAHCSCGWSSSPTLTAAMAGDEWDEHRDASGEPAARHDVAYGLSRWA